MPWCSALALVSVALISFDTKANELPSAEAFERWGQAQIVMTGTLEQVESGPVGLSEPPLYTSRLQLVVDQVFRGGLSAGQKIVGHHSVRQNLAPLFPKGPVLVSLNVSQRQFTVVAIEELTPEGQEAARKACKVPFGWAITPEGLKSPWADLGEKAWPTAAKGPAPWACVSTGRPALLVGPGVELSVEPVPPKKEVKFSNPDGDGEYTITIKNASDKPVEIPALLSNESGPLWNESLVILCQGKTYRLPASVGVKEATKPTTLAPGQTLSTTVNILQLKGPEWPNGGYRIAFQFALGEQSQLHAFYYMSRHHDPLRKAAQAK